MTDIIEVIERSGVALKKNGKEWKGLCPFHQEDTPSFSVNREKGVFYCFGCGAKGNAKVFTNRINGTIVTGRELSRKVSAPRAEIASGRILDRVVEHYQRTFAENPKGFEYLKSRGASVEACRAFKIGYADGSLLSTAPKGSKLRDSLTVAGIISAAGREHFAGCIVFPALDESGAVTFLVGRRIDPSAKVPHLYLSGEKRGIFNRAGIISAGDSPVYLVEGFVDALAMWSAGFCTAVPTFGARGITDEIIAALKNHPPSKIVIAFDGDEAGREAAPWLAERLQGIKSEIGIVRLPDGDDPASLIASGRRDELAAALESARGLHSNASATAQESPRADELTLARETREYRIRDLNLFARSTLRVNIHARRENRIQIDTLDLFSAPRRKRFVASLCDELEIDLESARGDVAAIIEACEVARKRAEDADRSRQVSAIAAMPDALRREATALLEDPKLLERAATDLTALGYVGEDTNKTMGFLVSISRRLPDPLSVIILSRPSAGKSQLLEKIAAITPPEDAIHFSDLTPQALYYMPPDSLKHKLLIIEERTGSEAADYSIRELQSRKRICKGVPLKDERTGRIQTVRIEVEGPIAFMESTTRHAINPENSSRCFILHADESPEQTRRIHEMQRAMRGAYRIVLEERADRIMLLYHAAGRLLEPVRVVIPFVDLIDFPVDRLRARRDHARFLSLIEAIAFLHQRRREKINGAVVANLDDYAAAYTLAEKILGPSMDELPRASRQLLDAIVALKTKSFTRRELHDATGWSMDQIKSYIRPLEDHEYLEIERASRGSRSHYRLAVSPEMLNGKVDLSMIPRPEELAKKMQIQ